VRRIAALATRAALLRRPQQDAARSQARDRKARNYWNPTFTARLSQRRTRIGQCIVRKGSEVMDSVIYLVGLIVVIMFILSALGLR
jgi:hypothetical protein